MDFHDAHGPYGSEPGPESGDDRSLIERATTPLPVAPTSPAIAEAATTPPGFASRIMRRDKPAKEDTPNPSRRSFLKGFAALSGTAALGGLGYGGYVAYNKPLTFDFGLLKLDDVQDSEQRALAIDHRRFSEEESTRSDTDQQFMPEANHASLNPDGKETLIFSPDLEFEALNTGAQNMGGHNLTVHNAARNIYIPMQLLDHAANLRFSMNDEGKLVMHFVSVPKVVPTPITEQVEQIGQAAKHQAETAGNWIYNKAQDACEYVRICDAKPDAPAPAPPPIPKKKLSHVETSIVIDGADMDHLPNIHLYDKRIMYPFYVMTNDELKTQLEATPDKHFDLIHSDVKLSPVDNTPSVTTHYATPKLNDDLAETKRCASCKHNNLIDSALYLMNADGLGVEERRALDMGAHFEQGKIMNLTKESLFTRKGFDGRIMRAGIQFGLIDTPDLTESTTGRSR